MRRLWKHPPPTAAAIAGHHGVVELCLREVGDLLPRSFARRAAGSEVRFPQPPPSHPPIAVFIPLLLPLPRLDPCRVGGSARAAIGLDGWSYRYAAASFVSCDNARIHQRSTRANIESGLENEENRHSDNEEEAPQETEKPVEEEKREPTEPEQQSQPAAEPAEEDLEVLIGASTWPEAADVEEGVRSDWRERRDLVGSHGRMLLGGGESAPEQARHLDRHNSPS